jgi:hypothetical protein
MKKGVGADSRPGHSPPYQLENMTAQKKKVTVCFRAGPKQSVTRTANQTAKIAAK